MGSRALEYLHNRAHELEDRMEDQAEAAVSVESHSVPAHQEHHHDESNCQMHAHLHMAIITFSWTPLLIWLGIWIAFLSFLAIPLIPRLVPERIHCRGPPCSFLLVSF